MGDKQGPRYERTRSECATAIRQARLTNGLPQQQLADAIGTNRVVIAMYEADIRHPARSGLRRC